MNINGSAGAKTCQFYNVANLQILNSKITVAAQTPLYTFYNDQMIVSNSQAGASLSLLNGLVTNGVGNSLTFYYAPASLQNTNIIASSIVDLGHGTLTVSNNLSMLPETAFNYQLGTNAATTIVKGNLALGGNVNIIAGSGFTNGTYTLLTYTGSLSGTAPTLDSTPPGYNYAINTTIAGQVNLDVTFPVPSAPANLTALATNLAINLQWSASADANGYNVVRSTNDGGPYDILTSTAATNYSDSAVNPGTAYYYVVSATNSSGASPDSLQASAVPLPSLSPANLSYLVSAGGLQLSWPQDHQGWSLQVQTNDLNTGLATNWVTVPNSANVTSTSVAITATNGCVFFRLIYP